MDRTSRVGVSGTSVSERHKRKVPAGLRPWLVPLFVVIAIVVISVAPGYVAGIVGFVVFAGLFWMLFRANRGQDYHGLTSTDRFFRAQNNRGLGGNDRFLKYREYDDDTE
jgi:hypothetical protein